MWQRMWQRALALFQRDRLERELKAELQFHVDCAIEENLRRGMSNEDARRAALLSFGGVEQVKEQYRDVSRWRWLEALGRDVRYGVRSLRCAPGFTLVAVLTLALGIGATTAIFTVVYAVLLRPLPYAEPEHIVAVGSFNAAGTGDESKPSFNAPADFLDWRRQSQSFAALAAITGMQASYERGGRVETLPGALVTEDFFAVLGVAPQLGRTFIADDFVGGATIPVVLSHAAWLEKFGGDPTVINQTLPAKQSRLRIIGVMPPDFRYPRWVQGWQPLPRNDGQWGLRGNRYFDVVGRLKPQLTSAQAEHELQSVAAHLAEKFPKDNAGWSVQLIGLREWQFGENPASLWMLFGAVALVLLIGCANVANLMMVRTLARRRELVVRLALGASRWQLWRQLLTESLLLAFAGGALGVAFAVLGIDGLLALLPEGNALKLPDEIHVDRAVLLFTATASLLCAVLFGALPAALAGRADLTTGLNASSRTVEGGASSRLRHALIAGELALALVLLVGAGLLLQSLRNRLNDHPGYDAQGMMLLGVSSPLPFSAPESQRIQFYQQVLERVAQTPGVTSAALTNANHFGFLAFPFNRADEQLPQGDANVRYSAVSASYRDTLGLTLKAGRWLTEADSKATQRVFVINEKLARTYFAEVNAIGRRATLNYLGSRLTGEIIGVVSDIRQNVPGQPVLPEVYASFAQMPWFSHFLVLRSRTPDPQAIVNEVAQAIRTVDPQYELARPYIVSEQLAAEVAEPRLYSILLGLFAVVALGLAALGIYGVMAYAVGLRTREFGIRLALGAQPRAVLRLVLAQSFRLIAVGLTLGFIAALALTRVVKSLLFGVVATDVLTFAAVTLLLALAALLACWIPARRAMRVDPAITLRSE